MRIHTSVRRLVAPILLLLALAAAPGAAAAAQPPAPTAPAVGGEANLVLPDLSTVDFRGVNARTLLGGGLVICALGLGFGLFVFAQLKNLPVHASMREVSELTQKMLVNLSRRIRDLENAANA